MEHKSITTESVICRYCKITFKRRSSNIKRIKNKENQFCSHQCRANFCSENKKPTTRAKTHDRHNCRIIAEDVLKRALIKGEIVHHIDENEQNDDWKNLAVLPTIRFHYDVHHANRDFEKYKLTYIVVNGETTDPAPVINTCIRGHEFTISNTYYTKTGRGCRTCVNKYQRERRAKIKALK